MSDKPLFLLPGFTGLDVLVDGDHAMVQFRGGDNTCSISIDHLAASVEDPRIRATLLAWCAGRKSVAKELTRAAERTQPLLLR